MLKNGRKQRVPKKKTEPTLRNHLAASLQSRLFAPKTVKSKKTYDRKKENKVSEEVESINKPDDVSEGN